MLSFRLPTACWSRSKPVLPRWSSPVVRCATTKSSRPPTITASRWCLPGRGTSAIECESLINLGRIGDDPFHGLALAREPIDAPLVPFVVPDDDVPACPVLVRERHHDRRFS